MASEQDEAVDDVIREHVATADEILEDDDLRPAGHNSGAEERADADDGAGRSNAVTNDHSGDSPSRPAKLEVDHGTSDGGADNTDTRGVEKEARGTHKRAPDGDEHRRSARVPAGADDEENELEVGGFGDEEEGWKSDDTRSSGFVEGSKSLFASFVSKDFQYDEPATLQAIDRAPSLMGFDQDLGAQVQTLAQELEWATENGRYGSQLDSLVQLESIAEQNNASVLKQIGELCIPSIVNLVGSEDSSEDAKKFALMITNHLCAQADGRVMLRTCGGSEAISRLTAQPLTDELLCLVFSVIGRYTTNHWKSVMSLLESGAVESLIRLMNTQNSDVLFHACAAMWNMTSYKGVFLESLEELGLMDVLVNIFSSPEVHEERVLWQAGGTMRNFVVNNAVTQQSFVQGGGLDCTLQMLLNIFDYSDRVQKLICGILTASGLSIVVKEAFRERGGFNSFPQLLRSCNEVQTARLALVLARLCERHVVNSAVVTELGLLDSFMKCVFMQGNAARLYCAIGVWGISLRNEDVVYALSERGHFEPLVKLLICEPDEVSMVLLPLVANFLTLPENQRRLRECGFIPVLVDFLRSRNSSLLEVATTAVTAAVRDCAENISELRACDGFRLLFHLIPSSHQGVSQAAARALLTLFKDDSTHLSLINLAHSLNVYKPIVNMIRQCDRSQLTINGALLAARLVLISRSARPAFTEAGLAPAVGRVLTRATSNKVLGSVCDLIAAFASRYRPIQPLLIDEDTIPILLQLLEEDVSSDSLRVKCINGLWGMSIACTRARAMIWANNGVDTLAEWLLRTEKSDLQLHTAVIRCIASVCSGDPTNQRQCIDCGVAPIIIRGLNGALHGKDKVIGDAVTIDTDRTDEDIVIGESDGEHDSVGCHGEMGGIEDTEANGDQDIVLEGEGMEFNKKNLVTPQFRPEELKMMEYSALAVWCLTLDYEPGGASFREHGVIPSLSQALAEFVPASPKDYIQYRSVILNVVGAMHSMAQCDYQMGRGGTNSRALQEANVAPLVSELSTCSDAVIAAEARGLLSYLP